MTAERKKRQSSPHLQTAKLLCPAAKNWKDVVPHKGVLSMTPVKISTRGMNKRQEVDGKKYFRLGKQH